MSLAGWLAGWLAIAVGLPWLAGPSSHLTLPYWDSLLTLLVQLTYLTSSVQLTGLS